MTDFITNDLDQTDYYNKCISNIIKEGGDTSSNASIVGAMIGALVGLKAMPNDKIEKITKFDSKFTRPVSFN